MRPLKVSAISFLNTAPLMWDFNHGATPEQYSDNDLPPELRSDFTIEYTVPSLCAEALQRGRADIGIIPAITYATIPGLVILPDAAIAAKSAVRSILLVSHKPIDQVNTIAADTSSRSSVALARILCQKLWGRERQFRDFPPDLDSMLAACDAALLIGDPGTARRAPEIFRLRPRRGMAALHRQAVRFRLLGGAATGLERNPPLARRRRRLPQLARSRHPAGEHRADRAPLECARRP